MTRHALSAIILVSIIGLSGCGMFSKKPALAPGNPLAVSNCPVDLPALTDDTFGAVNKKLVEIAGIYHQCAIAARGAK